MKKAISGIETVLLIAFIAVTSLVVLNIYGTQKFKLAKINTVTPRDEVVNDAVTADEAVTTSYNGGLTSAKVAGQEKDSTAYTGSNEAEVVAVAPPAPPITPTTPTNTGGGIKLGSKGTGSGSGQKTETGGAMFSWSY